MKLYTNVMFKTSKWYFEKQGFENFNFYILMNLSFQVLEF